jgi:G3E family GTPase
LIIDVSIRLQFPALSDTHAHTWESLLRATDPDWSLAQLIVGHHGDRLLRTKGLIYCSEDKRPLALHGVQRVFHTPPRLQRWVGAPKTTLVTIRDVGARSAIEGIAEALRKSVVEDGSATLDEVA